MTERPGQTSAGRNGQTLPLAPPAGMSDLLPRASRARAQLTAAVGAVFERYGYDRVTTPAFEHAEVLERGLETVDRRDLLRFVEPDTGEVALLRPDITPQVARIIATRLRAWPAPYRLSYQGTIIRRRRGRARKQQQIAQAGIECVGIPGPGADAEVVEVAAAACRAVGLSGFRIELGQVRIGRAALDELPEAIHEDVADALSQKDAARIEAILRGAGIPARDRKRLVALSDLYGDVSVLPRARRALRGAEAQQALAELSDVAERLTDLGLGDRLGVDLGEVRGRAYYTGVSFTVLADGPGEPVGGGGRYDNLLARFDAPAPATGVGLDLGNLEWALRRAGTPFEPRVALRVAVVGERSAAAPLVDALRAAGAAVAHLDGQGKADALAFARAWRYDAVLVTRRAARLVRATDGAERDVGPGPLRLDELSRWARPPRGPAGPSNEGEG